jgi:hypothetical protein
MWLSVGPVVGKDNFNFMHLVFLTWRDLLFYNIPNIIHIFWFKNFWKISFHSNGRAGPVSLARSSHNSWYFALTSDSRFINIYTIKALYYLSQSAESFNNPWATLERLRGCQNSNHVIKYLEKSSLVSSILQWWLQGCFWKQIFAISTLHLFVEW